MVSSVSFLIPPTAYPARCGLLTMNLLVAIHLYEMILHEVSCTYGTFKSKAKVPTLDKPKLFYIPQMLVNLFTSALSTTPSDGLTALTTWILTCIFFVFVALLFYVVILLRIRANSKVGPSETEKCNSTQKKSKTPIDLDISFLLVHLVSFGFFVIVYSLVYTP